MSDPEDRFTQNPGSTAFASMEEWLEYEKEWQAIHKAILRGYGVTPDGEEEDEDISDLNEYDYLLSLKPGGGK